jgi:hypothetical protein
MTLLIIEATCGTISLSGDLIPLSKCLLIVRMIRKRLISNRSRKIAPSWSSFSSFILGLDHLFSEYGAMRGAMLRKVARTLPQSFTPKLTLSIMYQTYGSLPAVRSWSRSWYPSWSSLPEAPRNRNGVARSTQNNKRTDSRGIRATKWQSERVRYAQYGLPVALD